MNTTYKRKILIVEDNEINRDILTNILDNDYEILEACDGQQGINILKSNYEQISLIVLDIQMPVLDGFEFLKIYRADPRFQVIPVIVTTSEKNEEEKCLLLGASDFVSKPYFPNIILRRVEALIRLKESTSALKETKFDNATGLLNKEYFIYSTQRKISLNSDTNNGFILIQITNNSYIENAYGEQDYFKLTKHIGNVLRNFENSDITFCKFENDKFMALVSGDNVDYLNEINLIKNKLLSDSPIKNIKYKFAYYSSVKKDTRMSIVIERLNNVIKNISKDISLDIVSVDQNYLSKEERITFIENNMDESLKNKEFAIYYQPKHDATTQKLVGAEALVRWVHPVRGFISPGDFVPFFEENGFITKLDLYILDRVCEFLSNQIKENRKVVPVSINLSRRDLAIFEDLKEIDNIVNRYNLDKKYIHFEITESICGDGENVINKTNLIREGGYQIEIDDFGSGYSSLGMITEVSMDYLKLDISFIKKISVQQKVASTVIQLAHVMNVKTVAEGVENEEQYQIVKQLGCDLIQGYYFSKPLSEDEFLLYLSNKLGD